MVDPTIVTGAFDIGRGEHEGLHPDQRRPFHWYLGHLCRLCSVDLPMVVYADPGSAAEIEAWRQGKPTRIVRRTAEDIGHAFPFYDDVQRIRILPEWRARAPWLGGSPQANLPLYNPVVMSKLLLLAEQAEANPFGSDHLIWVDAGITATVPDSLLAALSRLPRLLTRPLLFTYPNDDRDEIHGFERTEMERLAGQPVRWVARGGLLGGRRNDIKDLVPLWHRLLQDTLPRGFMGTEESVLTLMAHLEPERFIRFGLERDGLIRTAMERLANSDQRTPRARGRAMEPAVPPASRRGPSTRLYALSYNCPRQFKTLVESWARQPGFVDTGERVLIDNSTDPEARTRYRELCARYGFEHLERDNLGVSGGRQLAAEHFEESGSDFMLYLEDDMLLKDESWGPCSAGFSGYVPDLHRRALEIMIDEDLDFLKLSFSEVCGRNGDQWAWFNVSQELREAVWPELSRLPEPGQAAPKMPRTRIQHIGTRDGLSYATGEIFYANWPHLISRRGNRRIFLERRHERPSEHQWMADVFQLARRGRVRGGVLMASPVWHHRIEDYDRRHRRES